MAIARKTLVTEELRSGRLVQVLPGEIKTNWQHYALALPETADWPPLIAFVAWLRAEAREGDHPSAPVPETVAAPGASTAAAAVRRLRAHRAPLLVGRRLEQRHPDVQFQGEAGRGLG